MSQSRFVIPLFLVVATSVFWAVNGRPGSEFHQQGEWHTTSWEPCEPEKVFQPPSDDSHPVIAPQVGIQRRTLTCISANATVLPPSWCSGSGAPAQHRRCIISRPCHVQDSFSEWETVQQGCRGETDEQVVPEIQVRRRKIIEAPVADECPHLEERRTTDDPSQLPLCNQRYKWQPSPWSSCRADVGSQHQTEDQLTLNVCGGGIQMRTLTCLRLSDSRPVNQRLCRALALLPIIQHCEVPCDSDCQVGEWSPWSPCADPSCSPNAGAVIDPVASTDPTDALPPLGAGNSSVGYQFRHRRVLVNASADGTECPALSQLRRCQLNSEWAGDRPVCARWEVHPLLDICHLADNATCGRGYHELVFRCRRFDGVTVDDDQCANTTLPPLEQVTCVVHCPSDCVLSSWSAWTPCLHQGRRRRTRYVIGLPLSGGEPCPAQLMEEEICIPQQQHDEAVYGWLALPWSQCIASDDSRSPCGPGFRQRSVRCVRQDGQHVEDAYCRPLVRPDITSGCIAPCPAVDCRVSDWSEWSQCSEEDYVQTRIRVVLHDSSPAAHRSCPPLMEKRSCLDQRVRQELIRWHVSPWSHCHLVHGAHCGSGVAVRNVYCRNGNNVTVDTSICLSTLLDDYLRLETHRQCHVSCRKCPPTNDLQTVDDEDENKPTSVQCPRNCIGTRALAGGERDECPTHTSQTDCPCERITLESEDWSTCLISDVQLQRSGCGHGKQYRRRKCVITSTGQLAPLRWCNEEDFETRPCKIACPVDCEMTTWSPWTRCNSTCGPGVQRRQRKIQVPASNGGRPCGATEEVQTCNVHLCGAYQWRASDWTPCRPPSAVKCGKSLQTRYVRCINLLEETVVDESVCDASTKPPAEQPCRIACPGECVVSSWTPWTTCQQCDGSRRRERSIIRNPIYNLTCPSLEDVERCASGGAQEPRNCQPHEWRLSDWSSCMPLGGSNCGEGVRTRIASCTRISDGYIVDSSYCDPHVKPDLTEMWCHVECPIDCQVSPWSSWDESECAPCGHHSGLRSRHREILMANNQFGRSCSSILRQQLPCVYRPCYEWRPSNWTHCLLDGAHCGTGVRRQLTDCFLADKRVDADFCRMSNNRPVAGPPLESPCKVLCAFEKVMVKVTDAPNSISSNSVVPGMVDDDISVFYYPNDGEFNIWMVAMIAIGTLFLVFVGVTIALICSSREESSSNCKRASVAAHSEFRQTVRQRVSGQDH